MNRLSAIGVRAQHVVPVRYVPFILILVILLLATAVRFHNLGTQSLWYDEGVAFQHSQRTLPELIERVQRNVHVPAYFGLLGIWEDFTGASEFALRSLSALFSILSIALTYALGKRLFSPVAGLAASAFVTLNTFNLYYAQETRMYTMLTAVATASMWLLVDFVQRPRWRTALALGLLNTIGIYTHYTYALVMVAQGILAVLWLGKMAIEAIQEDRKVSLWKRLEATRQLFVRYVAGNLLTIVLFLPWLPIALRQLGFADKFAAPLPIDELLRILQGWLAFGSTFELNMGNMGAAVYFFLLFGLLILPPQRQPRPAWWRMLVPVVWVVASVFLSITLNLHTRYLRILLPAQTAFALWMGRGVWVLWTVQTRERRSPIRYLPKVAAVFATLVMMINLARGLTPLYNDPDFQRDNYRQLVADIGNDLREGDAIILNAPGQNELFNYYYNGNTPVYPLPQSRDNEQILVETQQIIADYDRIFVVFYGNVEQDPDGIVERTLNLEAYPISDLWYDSMRLVRFVKPVAFEQLQDVDVVFGDTITLEQYALSSEQAQPGDVLQLRLDWMADTQLEIRYKVFVQLLHPEGGVATQRDSEPGGGLAMTADWIPGEIIIDNHALVLPDTLPPGDYPLIIGLYDADDPTARLPVGDGDFWEVAMIQIVE